MGSKPLATGPDHPRSRGVYDGEGSASLNLPGSSPLARGLLTSVTHRRSERGIIPARAGFTRDGPRAGPPSGDHPRSRGVYAQWGKSIEISEGSSPLARGLREWRSSSDGHRRIIPARAGFTLSCRREGRRRLDHPRSRGVYRRIGSTVRAAVGSSPLARGLLATPDGYTVGSRIIPARAGFTRRRVRRCPWRGDHPRSRGVYVVPGQEGDRRRGIIPARAGFT